jgi:hypothetical protein
LSFGKPEGRQGQQSFSHCLSEIERTEDYETLLGFYERLSELKKDLINHIGKSNSRLAIIAHREVL